MSEVRLVVREAECDWSGTIHGSCADRAVAALSADPVTMEELETATERFAKPSPDRRFFANLSPGLCDDPYDAGLVVIDLVARLVVVDSTYSAPGSKGAVWYHDGRMLQGDGLRYHLADDWLCSSDSTHVETRGRGAAPRASGSTDPGRPTRLLRPAHVGVRREAMLCGLRPARQIAALVREQWAEDARSRLARSQLRARPGGCQPVDR